MYQQQLPWLISQVGQKQSNETDDLKAMFGADEISEHYKYDA